MTSEQQPQPERGRPTKRIALSLPSGVVHISTLGTEPPNYAEVIVMMSARRMRFTPAEAWALAGGLIATALEANGGIRPGPWFDDLPAPE
ncbi:hypothetical protein [Agromyces indicus]|uniref:Uncharacterized protein n=1 Tax=Agromyces indicus TaxID=758919 RepID=A0ABU1FKN4_9MICO|nr:hypothetical protein [Agromyces indicus]MDR5691912.1 hypothetical protein [Agromyces indicus]